MIRRVGRWIDDRTGLGSILDAFLTRPIPKDIGWPHVLGSALLFLIGLQFVTGTILALDYVASPTDAYASVTYLQKSVLFGGWLEGIHLWTASAIVLLLGLHMVRTFLYGAYKYPRELNWLTGVGLFTIVLGFSFTGYLLPWDQKAYWATVVGTNIAGAAPVIGGIVLRLLRGGTAVGAVTLAHFYAFHVLILPAAVLFLLVGHLFGVIRQGIAAPPRRRPLVDPLPGESTEAWYRREYAAEKRGGKPFYVALLKDALVVAVLFSTIIAIAAWQGTPLGPAADPNSTSFVPRPEWYFLDLFQLLWYVKGSLEPLGIFIMPTVGIIVLLALPFFDRGRERHPFRRPVATGAVSLVVAGVLVLTYLGATSPAPSLSAPAVAAGSSPAVAAGANLFAQEGCITCHTIDGHGGSVGPNLTHIGSILTTPAIITRVTHGGGVMPAFSSLSPQQLQDLAAYLGSHK